MSETKITDLVPQETIDKIKELNVEIQSLLTTYTQTAKELAKGIDVNVKVVGDIDKLEKMLADKSKEAAECTGRLNTVISQQSRIVADTTNTISRQLMMQERVNKTQRETFTEYDRVKRLLDQYYDTYQNQLTSLVNINEQLKFNSREQKENEKELKARRITTEEYLATQARLIEQHRALTQQKRTLTQVMTAEEKAMQAQEGSYVQLSQQLELLKKAKKDIDERNGDSEFSRELEATIQNLDAHLKDVAADMGEFQRNVGNYAIAGQKGIVTTESLMAVLSQQAVTTKDLSDQSKILMEARSLLDTNDAGYEQTLAKINDKLAENRRKLCDVSDIMEVNATSVAEAEAQNKRLTEALKNVDLTAEESDAAIATLNKKIEENNRIIEAGNGSKANVKKNLKELVMEIANLTIEYQRLSEEEKASAKEKELANHIQELTEQAGVLKDAIADTSQAIANAASDTRGFDQISEALQLTINGFGLATGAAEMLGISEGELAEIQTKLQAAIAASNAMSKIQATLQKQSAFMQGVANLQTKAGTIAIKLKTAAEGKGVITTKLLTAAQWLFNKACKANPIGLLVTAILACIAAVKALTKVFLLFGSSSADRKKKYQEEAKALDDLKKVNEKAIEGAKARGASEWEATGMAIDAKREEMSQAEKAFQAAKLAYDDDAEEYKKALEDKETATEDFNDTLNDSHNKILEFIQKYRDKEREAAVGTAQFKKEKAQETCQFQYDQIIQYYAEEQSKIREQIEFYELCLGGFGEVGQEMIDKLKGKLDASFKAMDSEIGGILSARNQIIADADKEQNKKDAEAAKKATEARKKYEEEKLREIRKARQMELELTEDIGERRLLIERNTYSEQRADLLKRIKELGNDEAVKREAMESQLRALEIKHQRKLSEIEIENELDRLKVKGEIMNLELNNIESANQKRLALIIDYGNDANASVADMLKDELSLRIRMAENERDTSVANVRKRIEKCEITEEEGTQMIELIMARHYTNVENLTDKHTAKISDAVQKKYADERTNQDNCYISSLNALKNRFVKELAAAKGNAEKQAAIKVKYEEEQARISEAYAIRTAQSSVEMLEEVLKSEELSAENRLKYEKDLAKAKIDLETAVADAAEAEMERTIDKDNKASEKRLENLQAWMDKAKEVLSAINDLAGAVFDSQIEKIETQQEVNEAAGEAEQERIERLVEQNVITQEEGEARKRAAEDKTARKNEELEKKKAQIKYRQALFDKALSIANIGMNTAMALMQLWVNPGWPAAIPMSVVVGALGALQLATVLATPIPKYARGTDYHHGGPAIVGDGGRPELVVFGDKSWITPDKPTLVDMPRGASVIPSINDVDDRLFPPLMQTELTKESGTPRVYDDTALRNDVAQLIYLLRLYSKQQHTDAYLLNYELFKSKI